MRRNHKSRGLGLPNQETTRDASPVYVTTGLANELRQGEILSNIRQYSVDALAGSATFVEHDFCVIAMQDCDLLWDHEARRTGRPPQLNGILIYEAEEISVFRPKLPPGRDIWKRIKQNQDERYHVLEAVPASQDLLGQGLPPLAIDFKRFFTMTAEEIERQCAVEQGASRRCRLEMPYREHLQGRAAFYFQRATLPLPHNVD